MVVHNTALLYEVKIAEKEYLWKEPHVKRYMNASQCNADTTKRMFYQEQSSHLGGTSEPL